MEAGTRIRATTLTLLALVVGFTGSAAVIFAALSAFGSVVGEATETSWLVAVPLLLIVMAALDLGFDHFRFPMIRRQTPQTTVSRFGRTFGGFLWGLDAGSVFSTYRTSAASWGSVILALAGLIPVWAGLVYAAGFCLPLIVATRLQSAGLASASDIGTLVMHLLLRAKLIRRVCAATGTLVALVLGLEVLQRGLF